MVIKKTVVMIGHKWRHKFSHNILGDVVWLRVDDVVFEDGKQRVERLVGDLRHLHAISTINFYHASQKS